MPGRATPVVASAPESSVATAIVLAGAVGLGSVGITRSPPCVAMFKRRHGAAQPLPSLGGLLGRWPAAVLAVARLRGLAALLGGMRMLLFASWHAGTLREGLRP